MYELLKKLEDSEMLDKAVSKGIISVTIAGQKFIYEMFLRNMKRYKKKPKAVEETAIETDCSTRYVYRVITKMEG